MSPPPATIVRNLVEAGKLTTEEAQLSEYIPMAYDICVEADSGGHTDQGVAYVLMPAMLKLRNDLIATNQGVGSSNLSGRANQIKYLRHRLWGAF
jgi:trans-AT polyketide synthase/acyltransferase/oxidoreductase domain-containing protein